MDATRLKSLKQTYRDGLLNDIVPFWTKHSLDQQHGGYFNMLDRDGTVYDTDKAMWLQGRAVWLYATLYNTVEQRQEWLDAARLGYDFLMNHGFDTDGRMFFQVTQTGQPLVKRRYIFTETFGIIALAQYAKASGDEAALQKARDTFRLIVDLLHTPGTLAPKINPSTRRMKAHAIPMILLATAQELRKVDSDPLYDRIASEARAEILNEFLRPDKQALFETLRDDGELMLDTVAGRVINPGHAIEAAWFLIHEAIHTADSTAIQPALDIIRWSLDIGWDQQYGGLLYFVDYAGKPPTQLEWDQKLWWPHTEALYALLLAYRITGQTWLAEWYEKVHDFAFTHFPDATHGEWYGYLHRDGSVLTPAKGTVWKGAFHLPRAFLYCWHLLDDKIRLPDFDLR